MKVYEVIARAYAEQGGRTFFGLLGEGNLKLSETLIARHGVVLRTARHEQGAVAMADGYARVTRRPTLAVVTAGPGLVNAGVSVASAARARVPVLVLAGDAPSDDPLFFQRMDQHSWADGLDCPFVQVARPEDLTEALQEVWRHLADGNTVLLSIPIDVQEADAPDGAFESWPTPPEPVVPEAALLDHAARSLRNAERPALLVGRGALTPQAREAVSRLASIVGAPIATTLGAAGSFHGDPMELGLCGGFDYGSVVSVVSDADLVLVVGSSLTRYTTKNGSALVGPSIIRVDVDDDAPSENVQVDLWLRGDATSTLSALGERLADLGSGDARRADARQRIVHAREGHVFDYEPVDTVGGIDPRTIVTAVETHVPQPRYVCLDGGHFTTFAGGLMSWHGQDSLIFGLEFGAIGQGLLLAIGASVAVDDLGLDATVLAMAGDGGFLMNVQELETAARLGLPLGIIVFNDQAYGYEVHMLNLYGLDPEIAKVSTPNLAEVAQSFGAAGELLDDPAELVPALKRMVDSSGPYLIDARIDGTVQNWRVQAMFSKYAETH